eukprot:CAMPEP_0115877172 /NCGR_PEP_ID=MMETSP0287-20121206/26072_1 /TAXON_ID=412157 /ORGANISM="Chrysochromulina rotalis, Strain UIO044" /LENGTH=68 /DNA_ID=CAMNT_0003332651 /DNA_START=414 /DNA_END=615 /DNA_ORIENTATION=+
MTHPEWSATGPAIAAGGGPHACICCMSAATLSVSLGASSISSQDVSDERLLLAVACQLVSSEAILMRG